VQVVQPAALVATLADEFARAAAASGASR
jgi:hypothetical protein